MNVKSNLPSLEATKCRWRDNWCSVDLFCAPELTTANLSWETDRGFVVKGKAVTEAATVPQSADNGWAFGILEKATGNLGRENFLPWNAECNHGLRRRPEAAAGCAVRKRKTLRPEFRKGGLQIRG